MKILTDEATISKNRTKFYADGVAIKSNDARRLLTSFHLEFLQEL